MRFSRIVALGVACVLSVALVPAAAAASATLTMTPATTTIAVGSTVTLDINVDSAGAKTIGTDVIVKYDPAKLEFVSITKGTVYSSYSTEVKDTTAGTVSLSGFVNTNEISTGVAVKGVFAKVTFKGKVAGAAAVSFDFTQGDSKDSNVVDVTSGSDILTAATGSTITVGAGGTTPPPPPPPPPPPAGGPTPAPQVLPDAANINPTLFVFLIGAALLLIGSFGIVRSLR